MDLPVIYAISAGMLALVNPCGAAMLPAYIGYQLIGSNAQIPFYWAITKGIIKGVIKGIIKKPIEEKGLIIKEKLLMMSHK